MRKRASVRREAPLAVCPLPACRRSGTCRFGTEADPCRRLYETQGHFYTQLARKIERLQREALARRPAGVTVAFAPEGTPEFEERLKHLYEGLRARDEAQSAGEMPEPTTKVKVKRPSPRPGAE